jgi:hypothetical protein
MKSKFQEIDLNLLKLFNNISDLSGQLPNAAENFAPKITSVHHHKKKDDSSTNVENLSTKLNLDNFYKEFNDFRFKVEDDVKAINNKIKMKLKSSTNLARQNHPDTNDINNNNNQNLVLNTELLKQFDLNMNNSGGGLNQQFLIQSINQLQENDKLVLQNLTYKVNREELEKLQRHMGQEIERAVILSFKLDEQSN